MNRIEIYLIILIGWGVSIAAAEFHGRYVEHKADADKILIANGKALQDEADRAVRRASDDDKAHAAAQNFIAMVSKAQESMNEKYSKLPAVVVDARGCSTFSSNFGLRWHFDNLAGLGSAISGANSADSAVPASNAPGPAR